MAITDVHPLKLDHAVLLDALAQAGADVSRPSAIKCPFHEDAHPSAGTHESEHGWRFKCHGCGFGGDVFDVRARVNGTSADDELRKARADDTPPDRRMKAPAPPKVHATLRDAWRVVEQHIWKATPTRRRVFVYPVNAAGERPVVFRGDFADQPKRIAQGRRTADGIVLKKSDAQALPYVPGHVSTADSSEIYGTGDIESLRQAGRVVLVEGEQAAESLASIGINATTTIGGAGKASLTDLAPLAGLTVTLWPDADPPDERGQRKGIAHMRALAKMLDQLDPAPRLLWLDPDALGLAAKDDAADVVARYADLVPEQARAALERDLLDEATPMGPASEVSALIADAIAGRRFVVPWPWPTMGKLSRALAPATVTLLVASAGATKSIVLIEAAQHWHDNGHRPAVLELEDGRAFHLRRALAQRAGIADLTDDDWCREHAETAAEADRRHAAYLDAFGRCIHELPGDTQPTLTAIGDWIEAQALGGKRVIVVDPISIAEQTHEQYRADQAFTARVKRIAEQAGCSIVLVMHPRKGAQGSQTIDDIAGGAAYGRLAQTAIWLEHWPEAKHVTVRDGRMGLNVETEANRVVRIVKARNGRGQGMRVAFHFDPDTLRLHERGVLIKRGGDE